MSNPGETYEKFLEELDRIGLDLCASFAIRDLPVSILASLTDNAGELYRSLLLVGSRGARFWDYLQSVNDVTGHPFNTVSQKMTEKILRDCYPQISILCLYPGDEYRLPLQQLGHLAGWGRPSALGLDIDQQHGTWFAYRTALLVSESLPQTAARVSDPVCETCVEKPCRTACPVEAVQTIGGFNISACMGFRVRECSPCADKCLARLACPFGVEYRYSPEQLAHHSSFSLASIKRYMASHKC